MSEISDELLEELKDAFDIFDKTGAETCAANDLGGMLQSVGLNPITADIKKVIVDSELEGKQIDFPTFVSIYEQFKKRPTIAAYADLLEAFKTYDREGNGQISGAQLRNMMTIMGDAITDQQYTDCLTAFEDGDGEVKYEPMIKGVMAG
jgi:Ca2+-binding EF-hand superfamily protein